MKTNSLVYRTDKIKGKQHVFVTIRLNDECKNGHQDFAITADIYEAGKPKTDRYNIMAGCCHDEILQAFPEFKPFVQLHLADYLGNPMYATANGYYHLKNGFNNTPVNSPEFKAEFCEYYRISTNMFDVLSASHSVTHYAINLLELDIPALWKQQADEAIKTLESLTGHEFIVDSVKNQFGLPTEDKIESEKQLIANGYYSDEAIEQRKIEANNEFVKSLEQSAQKDIDKINMQLRVKKALFSIGGKPLLENAIYYAHNHSLGFNWRSYGDKMTQVEADNVIRELLLNFKLALDYTIK